MRNFINIITESVSDDLHSRIADQIEHGIHRGDAPFWKLVADSTTLDSMPLMLHIAALIREGKTSGIHPEWDLKVIDEEPVDETVIDETVLDEAKKKHKVVPVHQRSGIGSGWWQCPDEEAELFVVEDEAGEPLGSYADRNSADAHCDSLNSGEQLLLDEDDIDPTDNDDITDIASDVSEPSMYADDPDWKVEVAAIHERGFAQDEALRELDLRGVQLSDEQLGMAGKY